MSNGWALDPDNRQDENEILPLEEMNPALFKEGSSAELTKKLRSLAPGDTTSGGQLKNDPDSTAIAHRGVAYRGRPSLIPMSEGDCHWNIATLYEKGKIDTIVIGYGHNFQGWHQHTWGLKDGKVVESSGENSVNDVWFGVPLSNDEALKFCAHTTKNQPGQGMVRTQKGGPHTAGEEEDDRYSLFYVTMQDQRTPMLQPTSMTGTLPEITEWARDSEKNQFTAKYFALYAFPTEGGKVRAWISPNFKESDEGNTVSTAEGIRLEMKNKGDKDSFIPFNEVIKRTASDDSWKAQSSGVVPICSETKRICLAWRSDKVEEGNCWGTLGGAVKKDMSPEESARTELQEETGYSGPIKTHAAFVFKKEDFTYSNFIGVVDEEFAFQPTFGHEWENDSIEWFTLEEIEQDIKDNPKDYHPGIVTLFEESKDLIHGLVEGKAKQAGELRDSEVMRNNPPEEPLTPEDDTVYALCFNGRKPDTIYTTGFNGTAKQIVEWVNNFEKTTYSIYDKHVKALNTSLDWPGNRPEDSDEFPLNFTPDQKELCKRFGTLDAIAIPAEGGLVQEMRWNASTSWRMFPSDTKVTASEGIKIEGMNANFVGKQIHLPKFRLNGSDEEEKYSLLFMELLGVTDGIATGFSGSLEAIKQWLDDDFDKTTFNKYLNEDTLAHDQEELCNYYAEGLNPAIVPTEGGRIYTGTFSGERSPMTRRQGQYGTWRLEPSSLEVSVSEGIKIDALNSLAVGRILKCPKIKTTKKASEEPEIYALYFRYYGASAGTLVSSGVNGTSAQIREWLENFERTTNAEYNVWMESMNNGDNDEEYPKNFNEEQRSLIDYYHDYGVIAVPVEGGQVLEGQFQGGRGWDADTQQIVENSSVDWKLNPIDDEYVSASDGIKLEGMNIFVGRKTKMPTFIRKKASDPREGVENCQECGEHLNGDDVLEVNKKVVCPDCADKFHRKEAILEEAANVAIKLPTKNRRIFISAFEH
jgi:8-oxo-dGTP pyrophosphatase MutT (NUDIX family)